MQVAPVHVADQPHRMLRALHQVICASADAYVARRSLAELLGEQSLALALRASERMPLPSTMRSNVGSPSGPAAWPSLVSVRHRIIALAACQRVHLTEHPRPRWLA